MSASADRRVVIVGGGHNGLVAAWRLARAGLRPLVLERSACVGGAAITSEIHPGFRCPALAHAAGPLLPDVARALEPELRRHGLDWLRPDVRVTALDPAGGGLVIHAEPAAAAAELARFAPGDGRRYPEFLTVFERIGRLLRPVLSAPPPDLDGPRGADWWRMLQLARGFRGLGRKDGYRLLRWGPMAVADLVAEWFESERARALFAARGIHGCFAGPWSAGTGSGLLIQAALDGHPALPAVFPRGGPGALSAALAAAATAAGAEIRTAAEVAQVLVAQGRVARVVLTDGAEVLAGVVVSGLDPRTTFLRLVDPVHLDPSFLKRIGNFRAFGVVAKVNLALSGLPAFRHLDRPALVGRIHVGPTVDDLEQAFDAAKYGQFSPRPYLDLTIPSLLDSSLAPAGAHVMSVHVQFAPYRLREASWDGQGEVLADGVIRLLAEYAPDLPRLVLARQVVTPADLESVYGLSGGHPHHGEHALDQLFAMRPLLGWARHATPIEGLYLCGAGTHPGGGLTGAPGWNAAGIVAQALRSRR